MYLCIFKYVRTVFVYKRLELRFNLKNEEVFSFAKADQVSEMTFKETFNILFSGNDTRMWPFQVLCSAYKVFPHRSYQIEGLDIIKDT